MPVQLSTRSTDVVTLKCSPKVDMVREEKRSCRWHVVIESIQTKYLGGLR